MRLLRILRTVLWSFFGVRRRADAARDLEGVPPHLIVAAAIVVATVLLIGIAGVVRLVTGPRSMPEPVHSVPAQAPVAPVARAHETRVLRDTMEERVRPCTVCHGSNTEATADGFSPRIAGKPAGYLFNQLVNFRDGRRTFAPMVYLVQNLSDEYLHEIAVFYSRLTPPLPTPIQPSATKEALARGAQWSRTVPASRYAFTSRAARCPPCHAASSTRNGNISTDIPKGKLRLRLVSR